MSCTAALQSTLVRFRPVAHWPTCFSALGRKSANLLASVALGSALLAAATNIHAATIIAIAAGNNSAAVLKSDGSLWKWGYVGGYNRTRAPSPQKIGSDYSGAILAGMHAGNALKSDGSLWQLGNGSTSLNNGNLVPFQLDAGPYTAIATDSHTLALKADGSLWAWGSNNQGQLGDGTTTDSAVPIKIGSGYTKIVAGSSRSFALKSDGSLWAWGYNNNGLLGDGTTASSHVPIQVGTGYTSISPGSTHVVALKGDGSLWAWGDNSFGQFGNGSTTSSLVPVRIGTDSYTAIAAGSLITYAIKSDGSLWGWGNAARGADASTGLGEGSTSSLVPVQVGTGFAAVVCGTSGKFAVALKTDGSLWTWGSNGNGYLGDGTLDSRLLAKQIYVAVLPGSPAIGAAVAGDGQAIVHFTALAFSEDVGPITGYTVTSYPGNFTATGTASPITVTGLTNGTAYTFNVAATNGVGTGAASAWSNSEKYTTLPSAPASVSAIGGNGQATVSFTAPANTSGSAITAYTAISAPGGFKGTCSAPCASITVAGLTNGTAYSFAVTATSAIGTSPPSASSASVTPAAPAFTVSTTAGANGGISPASQSVTLGRHASFSVAPAAGYSASVSGCGGMLSGNTYTTGIVSADCTVSATFFAPGDLAVGWNLAGNSLSTPLDVKTTFGDATKVSTVWKWDPAGAKWAFYAPTLDTAGTLAAYAALKGYGLLATINPGEGFWVNALAPVSIGTRTGASFSLAASHLATGWNLAATADDIAPGTFAADVGNVTTVWAWDNASSVWYFHAPSLAANNTLASYIQTKGYKDFGTLTLGKGLGFWVNYAGAATGGASPVVTVAGGNAQAILTWTPADAGTVATSNNIYYSSSSTNPGVIIANGSKVTNASSGEVITGLDNGTTYYFVVTAANAGSEVPLSSAVSATPVLPAPALVLAAAGNGQASVNWSAVTGAASYNVYYSATKGVSVGTATKVSGATFGSAIASLSNFTPYYFVVTAEDATSESVASAEMSTIPFATASVAPRFAYAANHDSNNVTGYLVDPITGELTAMTSPFAAGTAPNSVTVDAAGQFAYVANGTSNDVSAYAINRITGELSAVSGSPFAAGTTPTSVTLDPSGSFAYVANSVSNDVSAYKIDRASGALAPVSGSPFAAGTTPNAATVDPSGQFAYVANKGSASVSAYMINSATGALTAITGSPFAAGSKPAALTVDPSGKFAYVVNSGAASVSAYAIDPITGALTAVTGSPFGVGTNPVSVAIDPTGRFAYVVRLSAVSYQTNINIYTINRATGALAYASDATAGNWAYIDSYYFSAKAPNSVAVDPSGKFAYVTVGSFGAANYISAFPINATTGALSFPKWDGTGGLGGNYGTGTGTNPVSVAITH